MKALLAILAAAASILPAPAWSQAERDGSVKAAIVYNFSRFATWPSNRFTGTASPLVLCVDPADPAAGAFAALEAKAVGSRTLHVELTGAPSSRSCHIAYVTGRDATDANLVALQRRGVLTVGEGPGFGSSGAIRLIRVGRQLRFEVNNRAARAAGVELSSQLLRLAVSVR